MLPGSLRGKSQVEGMLLFTNTLQHFYKPLQMCANFLCWKFGVNAVIHNS